ncbi:hypothetical protein Gotri_022831 [Gossypium trilobum]|uniref:Zinc knuckle CX2CX4HX4C domain-containing protein n=1 Tax=Gossypium trilobum TaxID=34281 RepID=A0A7J9DHA7_9ROSI|nr:hypothetical protein [Gossypium trilobum]
MSEGMARQMENFIGEFLDHNAKILTKGFRKIMCIKVCLDVQNPLKRKKRVTYGEDKSTYADFQYERLSLFCFLCGQLGHDESFCPLRLSLGFQKFEFGWDISLRIVTRRETMAMRFHGVEDVNSARGKGVNRELCRRFQRLNQVNEIGSQRCEDETIHNMITESNEVLEERPIGPAEGKKRQRVQQIEGREDFCMVISHFDSMLIGFVKNILKRKYVKGGI